MGSSASIPYSFNPRVLAGGRDTGVNAAMIAFTVSIHASSREDATVFNSMRSCFKMFQSTRPRGRTRHASLAAALKPKIVSIHASSREDATPAR